MINYSQAAIRELWIHFVGNPTQNEGLILSRKPIDIPNEETLNLLHKYFFENFSEPEFYSFDFLEGNIDLNPVYNYAKMIFEDPELLGEQSVNIAKYLEQNSKHPNIKSGDLLISYISDLLIEDEVVDAICIFKSENKDHFITIDKESKQYVINNNEGIHAGKIDKACIILNTDSESGYKLLALDRSNKSKEAQFWIEKFLNITHLNDDYHHTKHYIQATKAFVTERLKPLYEIDKTQEADIMNRSLNILKNSETMRQAEFDEAIFQKPEYINDFQLFKLDFQQERKVAISDEFNIHPSAIKNQSRVFKSVLKLDKNFHVYIHGNRNMIEKGVDPNGRKYYKIYYEEEN